MAEDLEPSQYPKYQVRLANPVYGFLPGTTLWGGWVWLDVWEEFDGDALRKKHGERRWALRVALARRKKRFEIEGITKEGRPVPLSRWRLEELERERVRNRFKDVDDIAAELQGIAGLGEGELVYHLREHVGLSPGLTVRVMQRLHYKDVDLTNLAKKRGYGADRVRKGLPCGACGQDKAGRQREKTELVR